MAAAAEDNDLDQSNVSLYKPGSKIIIPLAKPNFHLTQQCYRGELDA